MVVSWDAVARAPRSLGQLANVVPGVLADYDLPDLVAALAPLVPVFWSYVLSFVYLGIYWNNHHHMLHTMTKITGPILWANLHLLFWLSLIPFVTGWMGENHFAAVPSALYGVVLLMSAIAYFTLQQFIIAAQGRDSLLKRAIGNDWKGKVAPILCVVAIAAAFWWHWVSMAVYVFAALIWLIPDRRIEKALAAGRT